MQSRRLQEGRRSSLFVLVVRLKVLSKVLSISRRWMKQRLSEQGQYCRQQ